MEGTEFPLSSHGDRQPEFAPSQPAWLYVLSIVPSMTTTVWTRQCQSGVSFLPGKKW